MKFQTLILTIILIPTMLVGQSIETVKKYEFKRFNGYSFSKEHKHETGIEFQDKASFFTPDSADIQKLEYEISGQYISAMEKFLSENQWENFDNHLNSYSEEEIKQEKKVRKSTINSLKDRSK